MRQRSMERSERTAIAEHTRYPCTLNASGQRQNGFSPKCKSSHLLSSPHLLKTMILLATTLIGDQGGKGGGCGDVGGDGGKKMYPHCSSQAWQ